jgi:hypothetical protein
MDVTKMPAPGTASGGAASAAPQQSAQSPARAAAIADQADIRPLDIPAALQILLAEVRASFELLAIAMDGETAAGAESPAQAARALIQMVLRGLPAESATTPPSTAGQGSAAALNTAQWNVAQWNAALERIDSALQAGLDNAVSAVSVWREVPASVVDATKETRALVLAILGDDPQNPIWLRPEWAGLAPRFERFWRRRRFVRRRLTDPDHSTASFDDGSEPRT